MRYPYFWDYPPHRRRVLTTISCACLGGLFVLGATQLHGTDAGDPIKRMLIAERASQSPVPTIRSDDSASKDSDDDKGESEEAASTAPQKGSGTSEPEEGDRADHEGTDDPGSSSTGAEAETNGDDSDDTSTEQGDREDGALAGAPPAPQVSIPAPSTAPRSSSPAGSHSGRLPAPSVQDGGTEGPVVKPGVGGAARAASPAAPSTGTPPAAPRGDRKSNGSADADSSRHSSATPDGSARDGSEPTQLLPAPPPRLPSGSATATPSAPAASRAPADPNASVPNAPAQSGSTDSSTPSQLPCTRWVTAAEVSRAVASAAPNDVLCVQPNATGSSNESATTSPATDPSATPRSGSSPSSPAASLPSSASDIPRQAPTDTRRAPAATPPAVEARPPSGSTSDDATSAPADVRRPSGAAVSGQDRWTFYLPFLIGMGCMTVPNTADGEGARQGPKEITVCGSSDGDR